MALTRGKKSSGNKDFSISFRVDRETFIRLKALDNYSGSGMTSVFEHLINEEYERLLKKDKSELIKSRKAVPPPPED